MTPTHTVTKFPAAQERCSCGCSDCQGECCRLECLTRPNFYCGQLLTDSNLKDMVDWVQAKSALQRFREGWGVACGLEVTCSHKDKEQARVYVSEGYAVDCCGRDIVVCEPIWYDFKCEKPFDSCCREPKPQQGPSREQTQSQQLGCIPFSELRAYELCLVFDEKMTGGQRALVRGNCYPMDDCQFTRVNERAKLVAKEVKDPCFSIPAQSDDETYRRKLSVFVDGLKKNMSSPRILLEYIRGKLHSFCFVEDCLCELIGTTNQLERNWADNFIFYIIQDFRNHYFQCLCDTCKDNPCDGDGVPLARVWLRDKKDGDGKICKVVYIDPYPPYRRALGGDCWRPYPGYVNLSRFIWCDVDEVRQKLCNMGLAKVTIGQDFDKKTVVDLSVNRDLISTLSNWEIVMRPYTDLCGRRRVVTFERTDTQ